MKSGIQLPLEEVLISIGTHLSMPNSDKPEFSDKAVIAILEIFMAMLSDKMASLGGKEGWSEKQMEDFAAKAGEDYIKFLHTYANINTKGLYKKVYKL